MISQLSYVCVRILSIAVDKYFSPLKQLITILISGFNSTAIIIVPIKYYIIIQKLSQDDFDYNSIIIVILLPLSNTPAWLH